MTISHCDPQQSGLVTRFWRFHAETAQFAPRHFDDRKSQYVDVSPVCGPNVVAASRRVSADDAHASHCVTFAIENDENKQKFDTLAACEHGIAPSWDRTGVTRRSCITRGRKQKWYKDLSLLGWPRLWRWLQRPAVMNGDHYRSLRTWSHRRRPAKGNTLHRQTGHGQASRFVRDTPQPMWGC
jgi:hypothetical protein